MLESNKAQEECKVQSPKMIIPRDGFLHGRNFDLCDAIKSCHYSTTQKMELCREMMRNLDELSGIEYEARRKHLDGNLECMGNKPRPMSV